VKNDMEFDFKDALTVGAALALVFGWENAGPEADTSRHRSLYKSYRKNGVDMRLVEAYKEELERRGVQNIPSIGEGIEPAELMARLHILMENSRYVHLDKREAGNDKFHFNAKQEPWPRVPEGDDLS